MVSPAFQRDLDLAASLGHAEFEMDIKYSEHLAREKFWFHCECGYQSSVRWSAADAMATARLHIRKVAKEHRETLSKNGGVALKNSRALG